MVGSMGIAMVMGMIMRIISLSISTTTEKMEVFF
jgi:hypothetical protein